MHFMEKALVDSPPLGLQDEVNSNQTKTCEV